MHHGLLRRTQHAGVEESYNMEFMQWLKHDMKQARKGSRKLTAQVRVWVVS